MKNIIIIPLAIALLTTGCAKKPGESMQSRGLVASTGINNIADISMIVYQPAGFGHLPMPSQMPLRSKPMQITAKTDITAIFNAVNQPDGKAETREARNNRLALIGHGGQVVMLGITTPTIYGCDITAQESSKKLASALTSAMPKSQVVKLAITTPIQSVSYSKSGTEKQVATATITRNQALLQDLFNCYSPLVLKGNRQCEKRELQDYAQRIPAFLTVKLAKPDALEAIIATGDAEWPPRTFDTSARLEQVKFDTITIYHENSGYVRFAFSYSKNNDCLLTDPVNSLKLLKEAQGRNPPVYGTDLYDDVVSALKS